MSATATQTISNDKRFKSYDLKSPDEHAKLYDEWALTYNEDVFGPTTDYVGPTLTVQAVQAAGGNLNGEILDAGCGTGLAGVALAGVGAKTIDGIDISSGMLKRAGDTKVYRNLTTADMTQPLPQPNDTYDIVTCVGTFTTGHVGPKPALAELVRVTKKGGIIASTIYNTVWKTEGFEIEVERLNKEGLVNIISTEKTDYRRAEGEKGMAKMVVLRKK